MKLFKVEQHNLYCFYFIQEYYIIYYTLIYFLLYDTHKKKYSVK